MHRRGSRLASAFAWAALAACSSPGPRAAKAPTGATVGTGAPGATVGTGARCDGGAEACVRQAEARIREQDSVGARALLTELCERDQPEGCSALARLLDGGGPAVVDIAGARAARDRGLALWNERCDRQEWRACYALAVDLHQLSPDGVGTVAARLAAACKHDAGEACRYVGLLAEDGVGGPVSRAAATRFYGRACALAVGEGCFDLGLVLQDGKGTDPSDDERQAVAAFEAGCTLRHLPACNDLALAWREGRGAAVDTGKALAMLEATCRAGHGLACFNAGVTYEQGTGVVIDLAAALRFYRDGCRAGSSDACAQQGHALEEGRGTAIDLAASFAAYRQACALEMASACVDVGRFLYAGRGVAEDEAAAAAYDRRACFLGDAAGCREMANLHAWGTGVPADATQRAWYADRACTLGDQPSCGDVADAIDATDPARARALRERHCATRTEGYQRSCSGLGRMAEAGEGGRTDRDQARAAYELACLPPIEGLMDMALSSDCESAAALLAAGPPRPDLNTRTQVLKARADAIRARWGRPATP